MVYVYRNLHKNCWSVLRGGKLHAHRHRLNLRDVQFRVRPAGQKRAVREGRKNVHAFAIGHITSPGLPEGKAVPVRYDLPKGRFVDSQGREVVGARIALLFPEGSVQVFDPRYA